MNIVAHGLWGAALTSWTKSKPYLVFFLICIMFSYPFFLQGKIPAPLDFLVNFYAPWDAYYDAPIKNSALSDVVSQIIPWKVFNAEELKSGRIPIWNLYNLAGTPHLGNWQSGVLYPTTLLFLFLPITAAWSLHILLQPLLAGLFTILFLRSLKLSKASSLIGAMAFAYGGFMTTWLEWGTLGHALLWLPLALASIENKKQKTKNANIWTIVFILAITFSLLAGHPQVSLYVIIFSLSYWLFRNWNSYLSKRRGFFAFCFLLFTPLLLAAPQVLPGIQAYLNSARTLVDGTSWAKAFLIPISGLVTFLAPDFFGNPVTRNSWSNFSYVEMQGYVGIVTFVLSLVAVLSIKRSDLAAARSDLIKFLTGGIVVALILATNNPVSKLIIDLKLPIISSSSPARVLGVVDFFLAVLAALGSDRLMAMIKEKRSKRVFYVGWLAVALVLAAMWMWSALSASNVAQRNLVLPSLLTLAIIASVMICIYIRVKSQKPSSLFLISYFLFLILLLDLLRFHHKFIPYIDSSMWYPRLPVLAELGNRQGRSFGLLDGNLNLPFRIYSLDGYDPMISAQYVKLTYPAEELAKRNRITGPYLPKGDSGTIDLISRLGVKWMVDSATPGGSPWDLRLWEYGGQFVNVWKDGKYQILLNAGAANEAIEPIGNLRFWQYLLFLSGTVISGVTIMILWLTRKLWN